LSGAARGVGWQRLASQKLSQQFDVDMRKFAAVASVDI
jgi:hypothetical protein